MYTYAVFWEGSTLLVIFSYIGNTLTSRLRNSSIKGYKELLKLKAKTALILKDGKEIEVPLNKIKINNIVIIKKNMTIPIDGTLLSSNAMIDKSLVTGESKIIINKINDVITSGTLNVGEKITIKVTYLIEDSFIYVLINKADDLSLSKPQIQIFVNRILKYFIPFVSLIAVTSFIIWIILGYGFGIQLSWFKGSSYFDNAMLSFVTVLSIACPCAFGIATPLIITIASSEANSNALLFNNPTAFEKVKSVKVVAFDKTGTLTTGKMKIVSNTLNKKVFEIISAIESHSIHPIAKAICDYLPSKLKVNNVKEIIGYGIKANYNGKNYSVLKSKLKPKIDGDSLIEVTCDSESLGFIEVIDEIKKNAFATIKHLQKLKIKTILITGDSESAAKRLNKKLNFDEIHYDFDPYQKLELIKKLRKKYKLDKKEQILYIGDGMNDLLAIKEADISMAFSSGSDIANSFADISILNQNIYSIVNTITLSRMTQRRIILSLLYAFIFNAIALPIVFIMLITPWIAAIIMLISNTSIILNSILFKKQMNSYFKNKSMN